jgi:hypothetical protein
LARSRLNFDEDAAILNLYRIYVDVLGQRLTHRFAIPYVEATLMQRTLDFVPLQKAIT